MNKTYKIKLTHRLQNSNAVTVLVHLEADSIEAALAEAKKQYVSIIASVASQTEITFDKVKLEHEMV